MDSNLVALLIDTADTNYAIPLRIQKKMMPLEKAKHHLQ
jgi:hypothetical protein